VIAVG